MSTAESAFQPNTSRIERAEQQALIRRNFGYFATLLTLFFFAAGNLLLIFTAVANPFWQVITILVMNTLVIFACLYSLSQPGNPKSAVKIHILAPVVAVDFLVLALLVENNAIYLSIFTFLYGAIISAGALSETSRQRGFTLSFLSAILILLASTYSVVPRIRIEELDVFFPLAVFASGVLAAGLYQAKVVQFNLRFKFLIGSLAIAIIPIAVISIFNLFQIESVLNKQNNQILQQTGEQLGGQIDVFFNNVMEVVTNQNRQTIFVNALEMTAEQRKLKTSYITDVNQVFSSFILPYQNFVISEAIINTKGENIADTILDNIGTYETNAPYLEQVLTTNAVYTSPVVYDIGTNAGSIYIAGPIRDEHLQLIGAFRIRYDALVLQSILDAQQSLSSAEQAAILLTSNYYRLADTLTPAALYRSLSPIGGDEIIQLAQARELPALNQSPLDYKNSELLAAIENRQNEPYFSLTANATAGMTGVAIELANQPWLLVLLQQQSAFGSLATSQSQTTILVTTLFAAAIGLFASAFSNSMTQPISILQQTAEKISDGDLEARADIRSGDELEILSASFSAMTGQLKQSIQTLETRVQERTHELSHQNESLLFRSRQLQTISDVARDIVSVQDLETLLNLVVGLISERFNFYHVGVFLVDERREFAVLRAANSEGGMRMLLRKHRLAIGQTGIVGYVTATGKPRIATDVGKDAVYFNNPDLPETRSEMALPLTANSEIIGALDVQSTTADAFSHEDIELFSILADQISIAIFNDRLYSEIFETLQESERIHRQYLNQQWSEYTSEKALFGYSASSHQTAFPILKPLKNMDLSAYADKPYLLLRTEETDATVLSIPIRIRGEVIGLITLEDKENNREWQDEELAAMATISDQIGQALENARLLEKTLERAEREKRVLEITAKIRSSSNTDEMISVALEELKRSLHVSAAHIILPKTQEKKFNTNILPPFDITGQE